jgi:hypothetical protein
MRALVVSNLLCLPPPPQDHYTAWRQTQEHPSRRHGGDGPFSFCSYPFLLDPRAKSALLHIEARFQMEQTSEWQGASRGRCWARGRPHKHAAWWHHHQPGTPGRTLLGAPLICSTLPH